MADLARFRRQLTARLGQVDHLVLFGSQVTGETHPDSDVDLIVVSPAFRGLSFIRRVVHARKAWDLPGPVDLLCYTPEEFEELRGQGTMVRLALDEGTEVEA